MDLSKLIAKLPKFVKKFQDSEAIKDGKVDWQDVLFVCDLIQLAMDEALTRTQDTMRFLQGTSQTEGRSSAGGVILDPNDHGQMMGYLEALPGKLERGSATATSDLPGQPGQEGQPREMVQWLPIVIFGVDFLKKVLPLLKKKK